MKNRVGRIAQNLRPIRCDNYDCKYEWDGVCNHKAPEFGSGPEIGHKLMDNQTKNIPPRNSVLVCMSMEQIQEGE